jgi:hypothetical protein
MYVVLQTNKHGVPEVPPGFAHTYPTKGDAMNHAKECLLSDRHSKPCYVYKLVAEVSETKPNVKVVRVRRCR